MRKYFTITMMLLTFAFAKAQIGINTNSPSANAILQIDAQNPDSSYGGLLIPTVTQAQLASLSTDANAEGLVVFVDDNGTFCLKIYNTATENWDIINCLAAATELIISEYVEGSASGDKYVEIYNPTTDNVDLSNYKIILLRNGGTLPVDGTDQEYTLSGTLAPGQTYVIADDDATGFSGVDQAVTVLNFSGNDPILLTDLSNNIIDVIGIPGTDPGNGYAVDNADTENVTLRRNYDVQTPNSIWTPAEWSAYPVDDFGNLGQR
jgi:hypothetical protein